MNDHPATGPQEEPEDKEQGRRPAKSGRFRPILSGDPQDQPYTVVGPDDPQGRAEGHWGHTPPDEVPLGEHLGGRGERSRPEYAFPGRAAEDEPPPDQALPPPGTATGIALGKGPGRRKIESTTEGGGVASIEEVRAGIQQALNQADEALQTLIMAREKLRESHESLTVATAGSGHDSITAGGAVLSGAAEKIDSEVIQPILHAKELIESYAAAL